MNVYFPWDVLDTYSDAKRQILYVIFDVKALASLRLNLDEINIVALG